MLSKAPDYTDLRPPFHLTSTAQNKSRGQPQSLRAWSVDSAVTRAQHSCGLPFGGTSVPTALEMEGFAIIVVKADSPPLLDFPGFRFVSRDTGTHWLSPGCQEGWRRKFPASTEDGEEK